MKMEKKLKAFAILTLLIFSFNFSAAAELNAPVKLISLSGDEMFPAVSPDGNKLAFVGYSTNNGKTVFDGVWLADLRTKEQKTILTSDDLFKVCSSTGVTEFSSMEVWRLSWNPNGNEILFSAYCRIASGDKVVRFGLIDIAAAKVKDLKAGEHPAWSPDGSKIVYLYKHSPTVAGCQRCGKELWVMNRDGSNNHMVFNVYGNPALSAVPECEIIVSDTIVWPSFSPDGKKILFGVYHSPDNSSINLVNLDGTGFKQLIGGSDFSNPQFTPDGKEIIFLVSKNNQTKIWSISSDGSGLKQLLSSEALKMNGLSVSPNGKKVFFPMVSDGSGFDIWMMEKEEPPVPESFKVILYSVLIVSIAVVCFLFIYSLKRK
jgi:Tol biopolymer transport system component